MQCLTASVVRRSGSDDRYVARVRTCEHCYVKAGNGSWSFWGMSDQQRYVVTPSLQVCVPEQGIGRGVCFR